ncbi:MAG: hypothetical protein AAGH81_17950 [Bacteroidota bacterium]
MKKINYLFLLCIVFLLFNCGDDEGSEGSSTEVVGEVGILTNLKTTNLDDNNFPWYDIDGLQAENTDMFKKLKSWNVEDNGLIPVKTNGYQLADQALNVIEQQVGKSLFDRTSIANAPDAEITKGLIVSQGTALGAFGSTNDPNACGHVSAGIGTTSYPSYGLFTDTDEDGEILVIIEDGWYDATGTIDTVLYVHIGAPTCDNEIDLDLVIHEFGHALGMGAHFEGFGLGPAVDENFWNVLHTIYNNRAGTLEENIVINQIEF